MRPGSGTLEALGEATARINSMNRALHALFWTALSLLCHRNTLQYSETNTRGARGQNKSREAVQNIRKRTSAKITLFLGLVSLGALYGCLSLRGCVTNSHEDNKACPCYFLVGVLGFSCCWAAQTKRRKKSGNIRRAERFRAYFGICWRPSSLAQLAMVREPQQEQEHEEELQPTRCKCVCIAGADPGIRLWIWDRLRVPLRERFETVLFLARGGESSWDFWFGIGFGVRVGFGFGFGFRRGQSLRKV